MRWLWVGNCFEQGDAKNRLGCSTTLEQVRSCGATETKLYIFRMFETIFRTIFRPTRYTLDTANS